MKRRIGLILFTLVAVVTVVAIYGLAVKPRAVTMNRFFEGPTAAVLYYRGLGLTDTHAWYGCYKIRQVVDREEYLFDKNGRICYCREYYPSGALQAENPEVEGTPPDLGTFADGCVKWYYENGQLCLEGGRKYRPKHADSHTGQHGPHREYDRDGNLTSEGFFLEGAESTREEWAEHLKLHPEDVRYGELQALGKMAIKMEAAIRRGRR